MSDYLGVKAENSMGSLNDPEPLIKEKEVKGHFEAWRQVYLQNQRATGQEVELKISGFNAGHKIPRLEEEFDDDGLSQDSEPLSKESGDMTSGQGEETVEGQQKAGAKPVGEDLKDRLSEINLEDSAGLACGPGAAAAAAEEQVGAEGQAANWDEGWEEECARYQDEEEETEDEDDGLGLSEKDLKQIYAELEKQEVERDNKYADNHEFAGVDPWAYIEESE